MALLSREFHGESDYFRATPDPAHLLVTFRTREDLIEGNHFQVCECAEVLWIHHFHRRVQAFDLHTGELVYAQSLTDGNAYCGERTSSLVFSEPPASENCTCMAFTPSRQDLSDLVWLAAANDLAALLPRIREIEGAEDVDVEEAQRWVWR